MIMLTNEVKLKLQELVKADREAEQGINETSHYDVLIIVGELVKLLPAEVTDGV